MAVGLALNPWRETPLGDVGFRALLTEYVAAGCTYYGLGDDWGVLQPSVGTIDLERILYPLRTIVGSYPQVRTFGLTITMLNGAKRSLPIELVGRAWDDSDVLATFQGLLTRIAMEPLVRAHVKYMLLGNEIFGGLPTLLEQGAFERFLTAMVQHVHAILPGVLVGTICDAGIALVGGPAQYDRLLAVSDLAAFTYYPVVGLMAPTPLTTSWQVMSVTQMRAELRALMARAGGKPVVLNEIGVSSSVVNGSSQQKQARMVAAAFDALSLTPRPVVLAWHTQHDYAPAFAAQFPMPVQAYIENIGLRSYATNRAKPAWTTFRAAVKGWGG